MQRLVGCLVVLAALLPNALTGSAVTEMQEDREISLPVLKTRGATYTNVTITSKDETKIYLIHDGGMGNVYVEDLDEETRLGLGYVPEVPTSQKIKAQAEEMMRLLPMDGMPSGMSVRMTPDGQVEMPQINPIALLGILGIGLFFHIFFAYCGKLICEKAGTDPGLMIWFPFFQVFPMLRAAGMSGWWVLALMVPILNLVASILWCFNIVRAREKSPIWAVMLILPGLNLIAFFYLAFSGGSEMDDVPPRGSSLAIRAA